jgi:hypothetical protein
MARLLLLTSLIAATLLLLITPVSAQQGDDAPPPPEPQVLRGRWEYRHGPRPFRSSYLHDILSFAPPNAIGYEYVQKTNPGEAARPFKFRHAIETDDNLIPGTCVEVDATTRLPLTPETGRDRLGGFANARPLLFGRGSVSARANMLSLRFGRIKNTTEPLLVMDDKPMVVRCGPLLQRDPDVVSAAELEALIVAGAFDNGKLPLPNGFRSYLVTGDVLESPFIFIEIQPAAPIANLELPSRQLLAAVKARAKRTFVGADTTEEVLRRHGMEFDLTLAYDVWNVDFENETAVEDLKAQIAKSFTCSPTPCTRRLRSRRYSFRSMTQYETAVAAASGETIGDKLKSIFADDLVDRDDSIVRPSDIRIGYSTAQIRISGDNLYERGFDLIPRAEPPMTNIAFGGSVIEVPETHYTLRFDPPVGSTRRWRELAKQLAHAASPPALTYTIAAHKFSPPRPQLSEMSPQRQHYVPIEHPLVVTEDCIAGRNRSEWTCPKNIVATLQYSKPTASTVRYMRPAAFFLKNLLREVHENGTLVELAASNPLDNAVAATGGLSEEDPSRALQAAAEHEGALLDSAGGRTHPESFQDCRRRHFGFGAIRESFIGFGKAIDEARGTTILMDRIDRPGFDLDHPVRLDVDLHFAMFLSQQPAERDFPMELQLVPSPGALSVTVNWASRDAAEPPLVLTRDDAVVVLPPNLAVTVAMEGEVFTPEWIGSTRAVDNLVNAVLSRVMGVFTEYDGELKALDTAGIRVSAESIATAAPAACGGASGFTISRIKLEAKKSFSQVLARGNAKLLVLEQAASDLSDLASFTASGLAPILAPLRAVDGEAGSLSFVVDRPRTPDTQGEL